MIVGQQQGSNQHQNYSWPLAPSVYNPVNYNQVNYAQVNCYNEGCNTFYSSQPTFGFSPVAAAQNVMAQPTQWSAPGTSSNFNQSNWGAQPSVPSQNIAASTAQWSAPGTSSNFNQSNWGAQPFVPSQNIAASTAQWSAPGTSSNFNQSNGGPQQVSNSNLYPPSYGFMPLPKKVKRETIDFCSHRQDDWIEQIYDTPSIKDWDLFELKKEERSFKPEDCRFFWSQQLIWEKKDWIDLHISRRIQLFFQQAILCYNTPFFYQTGGALDQVGQGCRVQVPPFYWNAVQVTPGFNHETQAAHSSTLPCLWAYPVGIYGEVLWNQGFVFLRNTHSYKQHNATVELPSVVNQVDSRLDGSGQENKLRGIGIVLINQVATGRINPTNATKIFLERLEERLYTVLSELSDLLCQTVIRIYLAHVKEVRQAISNSSQIFDLIMGVKLPDSDEILRDVVYRKRYELIQKAEFMESQIAQRIFAAEKTIFGSRVKSFKKVDYRLRIVLLQRAASYRERLCYEKYFCTSLEQLSTNLWAKQNKLRKVRNEIDALQPYQWSQVFHLENDLRYCFRELETLELEYRAKLFKGLRVDYKHWRQSDFVAAFKFYYPYEPMSQPMVSRLEQPTRLRPKEGFYQTPENQRRKEINILKAQKIAATYGIDLGLFLPSLITSE